MPLSWPASLPEKFEQTGFSKTSSNPVEAISSDTGPGQNRLRHSAVSVYYRGGMVMTNTQLQAFQAFYDGDTFFGVLTFTFSDPITENIDIFRFYTAAGVPSISSLAGGNFRVSFALERLPQ